MLHDAESEPKEIIQRTRNATRLIEFFFRSTNCKNFKYAYKYLENYFLKYADKLCRSVAIPTYLSFLKGSLLFLSISCDLHQQRKDQIYTNQNVMQVYFIYIYFLVNFNQLSGNKSCIIFQQLHLFSRIRFCIVTRIFNCGELRFYPFVFILYSI